ncbi:hypothetical protein GCM10027612_08570 [Microbispora bryophytorum subsp. camponoti]
MQGQDRRPGGDNGGTGGTREEPGICGVGVGGCTREELGIGGVGGCGEGRQGRGEGRQGRGEGGGVAASARRTASTPARAYGTVRSGSRSSGNQASSAHLCGSALTGVPVTERATRNIPMRAVPPALRWCITWTTSQPSTSTPSSSRASRTAVSTTDSPPPGARTA